MLWWVWDAAAWPGVVTGAYQGAYTAMRVKAVHHRAAWQLVLTHKVDFDEGGQRDVTLDEFGTILQMVSTCDCSLLARGPADDGNREQQQVGGMKRRQLKAA
jgi:hypothetical protein